MVPPSWMLCRKKNVCHFFDPFHSFDFAGRKANLYELDAMGILVLEDPYVALLHLSSDSVKFTIRFLNHVIDDEVVDLELIVVKIL